MLERLRSLFRKESRAGSAIYRSNPQAKWMNRRYESFADEGYRKNVVAYQAINRVSKAAAAVPFQLMRDDAEITDHPLLTLLKNPNPLQSGSEYFQAVIGFYMIAGNAYLERTMAGNQPRELYTLRPDRMTVKPGRFGIPAGYVYRAGNHDPIVWEADETTGASDVRHMRTFNPLDDWYGLSPIEAGAFAVDQHNESMQWMQALLQNGASPSAVLEVASDSQLGDDEYQRLKAEIDEQFGGSRNAGRPLLLEGGMTWKAMGFNPDQMAAIETRYASARDVALALGVPPLLLNIPGDSTYSNYQEARLALYEETVLPLLDMLCDVLNAWLVPLYGDGLTLRMDIDSIPAIADKRRQMWSMADASSDLTVNERREIKGYDSIGPAGDDIMVSANLIPLDLASSRDVGLTGAQTANEALSGLDPEDIKALAYGPSSDRG